jgi:hypothetical protein
VIQKNNTHKLGWRVRAFFIICLNAKDLNLLLKIQAFFGGVGSIWVSKNNKVASYSITSPIDLINKIIPHFEKFPLISQKASDFNLFKQIVELMNNKVHLTDEGLKQIINIKDSMNLGLSTIQKKEFPDFKAVDRPIINTTNIPDPNWLAGFVSGEGCFFLNITKGKTKIGHIVRLVF